MRDFAQEDSDKKLFAHGGTEFFAPTYEKERGRGNLAPTILLLQVPTALWLIAGYIF